MGRIAHARLDEASNRILDGLRRRTGLNDSDLIRRALRALADLEVPGRALRVIGLGRFRSGVRDLGSSKRHLKGFGQK